MHGLVKKYAHNSIFGAFFYEIRGKYLEGMRKFISFAML
jgi:hypothetical protein